MVSPWEARRTVSALRRDSFSYLNPRKRKFGYIGFLGHRNLGDEAMYRAFKLLFHKVDPIVYEVQSHHLRLYESILQRPLFDAIVLGGGTLVNRSERYLRLFQQAQTRCSHTSVFGAGVCSPEFWHGRPGWTDLMKDWCSCLHNADFIGVRGPISKQILEENAIPDAQVIGDLSLALSRQSIRPKTFSKSLGINIGVSGGNVWGSESNVLSFVVGACKELVKRGWKITFVPVWPNDLGYIEEAVQLISSRNVAVHGDFLSLERTMRLLEKLDVFVGEKLHSVALAVCVYTPSMMLEYRPKCRDFMASLGLDDFIMRTDQLCMQTFLSMIEDLYENSRGHQAIMQDRVGHFYQKLQESAKRIIDGYTTDNSHQKHGNVMGNHSTIGLHP